MLVDSSVLGTGAAACFKALPVLVPSVSQSQIILLQSCCLESFKLLRKTDALKVKLLRKTDAWNAWRRASPSSCPWDGARWQQASASRWQRWYGVAVACRLQTPE